mmetsp:Transcript_10283/g.31433  ORF Transcript_10283/g.31433 Transcript_10283/m.31433 type:complete len:203 (+) Transcript_10283:592-1200(+)
MLSTVVQRPVPLAPPDDAERSWSPTAASARSGRESVLSTSKLKKTSFFPCSLRRLTTPVTTTGPAEPPAGPREPGTISSTKTTTSNNLRTCVFRSGDGLGRIGDPRHRETIERSRAACVALLHPSKSPGLPSARPRIVTPLLAGGNVFEGFGCSGLTSLAKDWDWECGAGGRGRTPSSVREGGSHHAAGGERGARALREEPL